MMSSIQNLTVPNELPPFSPIVYEPPVKHPFQFETEYSREPARIRAVFDDLVDKTKEMNLGKSDVPTGKRRARALGLQVSIEQAKGLHWRSIQARHPVLLTAGPRSPPRTPRRPATDYPSAEQLCLKNMADAQKRQNYAEACRWSFFAERERSIRKWEAEQEAVIRARKATTQESVIETSDLSSWTRPHVPSLESGELEWEKSLSPTGSSSCTINDPFNFSDPYTIHRAGGEPRYQTIIEMPVPLMDKSQSIRQEATGRRYPLIGNSQLQSFNIPRGNDPSLSNVRLERSSSIQRHIPAASLRMAPTPLRPKIDHHPLSYPAPQVTRLSYIHPTDPSAPVVDQSSAETLGLPTGSNFSGLPSNQTTVTMPSIGHAVIEQTSADDYSLKKRRSEVEHFASLKTEQKKLR